MSFRYGATRKWVEAIRIVLADGDVLSLRRGENIAEGGASVCRTEGGRVIEGTLPGYQMPRVKSAAGYYVADDMDMIDLFVGSEGTLGVITEIELRLMPRPNAIQSLTLFLPTQEAVIDLVKIARAKHAEPVEASLAAMEFFDHDALDLLRKAKLTNPAFEAIPALKPHYHSALYLEYHSRGLETAATAKGDDAGAIEEAVMELMESVTDLGGSDDDTWFATTDREMEPIKAFRHATPEAVNLLIAERKRNCPNLIKLGTDMSVPDDQLAAAMAMYDAGVAENGLESVMFGHIGNNHIHVNILPHDMDEYTRRARSCISRGRARS